MAVQINTKTPTRLLNLIYNAINSNTVKTWAYDDDKDFSHVTSDRQWVGKAWLTPTVKNGALVLNVLPPATKAVSKEAYAVYHGRFIEMLLAHFDGEFSEALATSMPTAEDRVTP